MEPKQQQGNSMKYIIGGVVTILLMWMTFKWQSNETDRLYDKALKDQERLMEKAQDDAERMMDQYR